MDQADDWGRTPKDKPETLLLLLRREEEQCCTFRSPSYGTQHGCFDFLLSIIRNCLLLLLFYSKSAAVYLATWNTSFTSLSCLPVLRQYTKDYAYRDTSSFYFHPSWCVKNIQISAGRSKLLRKKLIEGTQHVSRRLQHHENTCSMDTTFPSDTSESSQHCRPCVCSGTHTRLHHVEETFAT